MHEFLRFSPRIACLPVVHGSGDFAFEVRRAMLGEKFDCLAVPLPGSFQREVERAVKLLPGITLVGQREAVEYGEDEAGPAMNFVPVDPCQPVIAAIRLAMEERIPRAFIDLETAHFEAYGAGFPDPYALKKVALEKFAAAILPSLPRLLEGQPAERIRTMARRLRELENKHKSILFVCSMLDWPWVREAYVEGIEPEPEDDAVEEAQIYRPAQKTLLFMLGELPFITGLYERARAELEEDEHLSIDGVKELLLGARGKYVKDLKKQARAITPQLLRLYLKYVRNLSLVERRLTPDLYTLVTAAQQFAGDAFALHVAETAREYPYNVEGDWPEIVLGLGKGRRGDGEVLEMINRLAGPPMQWRTLELKRKPERKEQRKWEMRWNPFQQCSWPPEDVLIERFRTHTFDRAKQILGQDLARYEKFTTSIKDGIDIRETLRNWHTGEIYVKNFPPVRGTIDAVVMLFDSPADPREYPYRSTWSAEHDEESTLAFFASDFRKNMVGPAIGQAVYGGALFIFPPGV